MAAPTAPLDSVVTTSDDGDSEWSDKEKVKDERFAFLADAMGVGGGLPFDSEDDVLANNTMRTCKRSLCHRLTFA